MRPERASIGLAAGAGVFALLASLVLCFAFDEPWTLRGDNKFVHFPMKLEAWRLWLSGVVPVWSGGLWSGFPLLVDATTGVFYLPHFIGFALTPDPHLRAFDIALSLHAGILVAGTIVFLGSQGCGSASSLFGAALTLLAPQVLAWSAYLPGFSALAWWPWLLFAAHRLATAGPEWPRWSVIASIPLGLQVLAGYPEMALYSGCLAGLWILASPELTFSARLLRTASLAGLAFLLAGPQLAPTALGIADTNRAVSQQARSLLSMQGGFFDFVDPRSTGHGLAALSGFLGAATLALAAIALARRRPRSIDLALVALVALLVALGDRAPVYALISELPLFELFRGPWKFFVVTQFYVIWLAAMGLQQLLDGAAEARAQVARPFLKPAAALLGLSALFEYAIAMLSILPVVSAAHTGMELPLSRAISALESVALAIEEHGGSDTPPPRVYTGGYLHAVGSLPMIFGIGTVRGGGVALLSQSHAWMRLGQVAKPHLQLLGAEWVIAQGTCPDGPRYGFELILREQGLCLSRNPDPRPRYELLAGWKPVKSVDEGTAWSRRRAGKAVAIVGAPLPGAPGATPSPGDNDNDNDNDDNSDGNVIALRHRPGDALLRVTSERDAMLLVRESWAPGWEATLDAAPVELRRAAGIFFAISVPPGSHEVAIRYRPPGLHVGVSLALLWLLLAWIGIRR